MNDKSKITVLFNNLFSKFKEGIKRFPVTLGFAAVASVAGLVIINIDNPTEDTKRLLMSIIMAFALGALVSLAQKTLYENFNVRLRNKIFSWIVFGCATALYIAYLYSNLEGMEMYEVLRFAGLSLAVVVVFMTAIFRKNTEYQEVYSTLSGWRLAITGIYTLIIWGGISLILFAIDRLLNVNVQEEAYMNTIVILLGFFSPAFFLSGIPKQDEIIEPDRVYKFFRILIIYVIAPLLTAYTVVFYIYALRILFVWNWPDGIVGNMVLWYALIGIVTMYFIHGMDGNNKWASFFGKWFPRIVILPIILLFISLAIRINAYGLTTNRYLLGITGLWMFWSAIYLSIVNYKKRCTRIVTVSLVILALVSLIGPWNAINTGRLSQARRLEKILVENNILTEDGTLQKASDNLSEKTKGEISDKLAYLGRSHDFRGVDFLPSEFEIDDMMQVFGFSYTYYYEEMPREPGSTGYVSINEETLGGFVEVDGYDYIWNSESWSDKDFNTPTGMIDIEFERAPEGSILEISLDDETIFTKTVDEYMEAVIDSWDEYGSNITLDQMTFDESIDGMNIRFVFTGVELYPDDNGFELGWIKFYLLIDVE